MDSPALLFLGLLVVKGLLQEDRSDSHSLGIIQHQLLTVVLPFRIGSIDLELWVFSRCSTAFTR